METQRRVWAQGRLRVAFVPTMGSLHEGHRSLIREAKSLCDRVIVSIFVNPTQFAEGEDLAEYPRDAEGDLTKAASAGADLVWFAQHEVIYPPDWGTTLVPKRVGLGLGDRSPPSLLHRRRHGGRTSVMPRTPGGRLLW